MAALGVSFGAPLMDQRALIQLKHLYGNRRHLLWNTLIYPRAPHLNRLMRPPIHLVWNTLNGPESIAFKAN